MKLLKKINAIRKEIKVEKEHNRAQGYKAWTIAKLNAEVNNLLVKYQIGVSFSIVSNQVIAHTGMNSRGQEKTNFLIDGIIEYQLDDLDSKEVKTFKMPLVGMNNAGDPSKSLGNAMSYSYKYFWVTLLGLTEEVSDVDSTHYNADVPPERTESIVPSAAEAVRENGGGTFKDKEESKKLFQEYKESFEACATKEQVQGLIVEAKEAYSNMLSYEQGKLTKIVNEAKKKWEIE